MPDGKPEKDAETVFARDQGASPRTHVRGTVVAGDCLASISPESLAGTIGLAEAVLRPHQLAALTGAERYAPVRELGRGGMGRVDVIIDRALGRAVARKTAIDGRNTALLVAEAQICAQLEHPSIVPVYDVGADADNNPHYTMRVIRGRTLRDVLADNAEPDKPHVGLSQLLGIIRQVCLAVEYAHSRGVVHRDLKPENIVVGEFGEVYVLDWGVAYVTPGSDIHRATPHGSDLSVAGSPGYMAPEQAMGEAIEPRTDVFALGVILHEVLAGTRPFDDKDLPSILKRIAKRSFPPPSLVASRSIPKEFDDLVKSCLRRQPAERPPTARFVAEAIDGYLDRERARIEREREAGTHAAEGEQAREVYDALAAEARRLQAEAESMLAETKAWEPLERKQPAWDKIDEARRLSAEAARALARAEAAFARALGRVPDHPAARRGLAALHFRQFEAAEADADAEKMAQYLDLARAFDDGSLALELADQGTLEVESRPPGAVVMVARYQARGLVLRTESEREVGGADTPRVALDAGSYRVRATLGAREVVYPLVIERACACRLSLRMPEASELPDELVLVPGGPFLALPPRAARPVPASLPDFAIARFPVTLRQYARFLDAIADPAERERRLPRLGDNAMIASCAGRWEITDHCLEGDARRRVPRGRELDLPVNLVSWFDAAAYVRWLAAESGLSYRLPSDLEWEKAMRGADGRAFPMGNHLDPSFAKLRESRPEATQPEPVGAFPLDASPYGVRDLAGGVGDWTSTSVDGASLPGCHEEGTDAGERQAYWRGGNWGSSATARGMRYPMKLSARTTGVGFRVALSLDQHGSSELVVQGMKRA